MPTSLRDARGPFLVTLAAFIFAGANACATAIYRRGGTIVTVFLLRCFVVYVFNGIIVARREGRAAAAPLLLLRTGRRRSSLMATARSATGALLGILLNLSFVLLTFADAFTIFKGVDTLVTIVVSRVLLGSAEKLRLRELGCGALTLFGLLLIARPTFLFGPAEDRGSPELVSTAASTPGVDDDEVFEGLPIALPTVVSLGGFLVATCAGVFSGGFNVFTRALSRKGGPHEGHLPPAMLLSYFMVVVWIHVALLTLIAHLSGLAERKGFEWTRLRLPTLPYDWFLLGLYCLGILTGQLAMAAGYATTRAGIAAFLALTELAFSYLLGVTALGEPTSLLASLGTAVVFGSVGAIALQPRRQRPDNNDSLASADAQRDGDPEAGMRPCEDEGPFTQMEMAEAAAFDGLTTAAADEADLIPEDFIDDYEPAAVEEVEPIMTSEAAGSGLSPPGKGGAAPPHAFREVQSAGSAGCFAELSIGGAACFTHEGGGGGLHKENQDVYFTCQPSEGILVYGVFDGHGQHHGKLAAEVASRTVKEYLTANAARLRTSEAESTLRVAFESAHTAVRNALLRCANTVAVGPLVVERLEDVDDDGNGTGRFRWDAADGGTTATVAVMIDGTRLVLATVGDSSVALLGLRRGAAAKRGTLVDPSGGGGSSSSASEAVEADCVLLMEEHSPTNLREYLRLLKLPEARPLRFVYDCPDGVRINIFTSPQEGVLDGGVRLDDDAEQRADQLGCGVKNARGELATVIVVPEGHVRVPAEVSASAGIPIGGFSGGVVNVDEHSMTMTRSIGDLYAHTLGMLATPETRVIANLKEEASRLFGAQAPCARSSWRATAYGTCGVVRRLRSGFL